MPAKSEKQRKFMQAVAHSPSFAKKVGVPQSVGREYSKAKGGEMAESKQMMKREVAFMKRKGAPKSMVKHEMAEAKGERSMKRKFDDGGSARGGATGLQRAAAMSGRTMPAGPGMTGLGRAAAMSGRTMPSTGRPTTMKKGGKMKKYAAGGLASGHKSADGVAKKGKTKGKNIAMARGGKSC